jgi:thiol-disulfide isomerase/thioredoxin
MKERLKALIAILFIVIVTILIIELSVKKTTLQASNTLIEQQNKQENIGLNRGNKAPNFMLNTLGSEPYTLWKYEGKAIILNFWATWCPPCREEMPLLQNIHTQNPDLVVIGVNLQEDNEMIQSFANELKLTFPLLLDPDATIKKLYQIRAQPTTYFIDKNLIIREKRSGQLIEDEMPTHLAKILN